MEGMKLYTAGGSRANRQACIELEVGLMLCDGWRDPTPYPYFAVDNGAFSAWKREERWSPQTFLSILHKCAEKGLEPDFAVLPDIVGGGLDSLELSTSWHRAMRKLYPGIRWALAVQDGMESPEVLERIEDNLEGVSVLFVGGTLDWKLATMGMWARFAHAHGLRCHIGRMGTVDRMIAADMAGADSVDSTTWIQRNGCLRHHVEAYRDALYGEAYRQALREDSE